MSRIVFKKTKYTWHLLFDLDYNSSFPDAKAYSVDVKMSDVIKRVSLIHINLSEE